MFHVSPTREVGHVKHKNQTIKICCVTRETCFGCEKSSIQVADCVSLRLLQNL